MATHSSVLAWRIPGTGELGGLPSVGSHRVGHDWSDLAAAEWNLRLCNSNKLPGMLVVRDWIRFFCISYLGRQVFYHCTTWEAGAPFYPFINFNPYQNLPLLIFFFFSWKHLPSALLPPSAITLLLGFLLWSSPSLQSLVLSNLLTSCCLGPVWAHHRKFVTNILHDWIQWWFLRLHSLATAAFHCGVTLVISARTLKVSTLHCSLFLGLPGLHWLSKLITTSNSLILDFSGGPMVKTSSLQCRGCQFDPWSGN